MRSWNERVINQRTFPCHSHRMELVAALFATATVTWDSR